MQDDIYGKLRSLREKKRYSQQDVADALHISQNTYSLLETGKTKLDVERLLIIAEFYKVPVYDILEILSPSKK